MKLLHVLAPMLFITQWSREESSKSELHIHIYLKNLLVVLNHIMFLFLTYILVHLSLGICSKWFASDFMIHIIDNQLCQGRFFWRCCISHFLCFGSPRHRQFLPYLCLIRIQACSICWVEAVKPFWSYASVEIRRYKRMFLAKFSQMLDVYHTV